MLDSQKFEKNPHNEVTKALMDLGICLTLFYGGITSIDLFLKGGIIFTIPTLVLTVTFTWIMFDLRKLYR